LIKLDKKINFLKVFIYLYRLGSSPLKRVLRVDIGMKPIDIVTLINQFYSKLYLNQSTFVLEQFTDRRHFLSVFFFPYFLSKYFFFSINDILFDTLLLFLKKS